MAYGLKYYKEFAWTNYANDTTGNTRIEILENNYSGSSVEIDELGETPVQLRLDNTGDMINQTIKKTSLVLSIIDTDQFDYSQFYTSDGKKYKVNLISSVANWTGYLVPQSFGQELGTNGLISITASDGLHLLQGIDYVADKNKTLKLADFIADIETKIGLGTFDRSISLATDKGDLWQQFIYEGMFLDKNYEDCLDMVLTAYGLQVRYWKLFPVTSILSHSFSGTVKCLDNVPMVDYLPIAKKLKINQNLTTLPDILEDAMVDDATDVIDRTPSLWKLAKWVDVSDNGLPVYPYKDRHASENMYKAISMYAIPTNAPYDTQRITGHEGSKYVLREFDSTPFQIEFNANFGRLSVYGRSSATGYQEKLRPISWSQIHWGLYDTKTNKSFSKATNSWSITGRPTYSTANTIRVDNPADSDVTVYINVPKTTGDVLGLELFLFTPSFAYNNPAAEATQGIFSINSIKIAEVGGVSENELYNEINGTINIGDNIDVLEYDYELGTSPSYPTNTSLYYGSSLYNNIYDQIASFTLAGNSVNQMQYLANTILYSNGAGRKSVFSGTFAPMNNGNLMFYRASVNNVNCLINSFTLDVRRVKFVDAEFVEIAPFTFTNYTITSESSIGSSDWGGSGGSSGTVGGGGGTVDTSNFVVKTGAVTQNIEGSVTVEGAVVAGSTNGVLPDDLPVATSSLYGVVKFDAATLGLNGSGQLTVIGGGWSNVSWGTPTSQYTPLTVDAVTRNLSVDGHTHSYLPLSGGNLTGALTISGSKVWHAGNDGTGSGLDADLLDGFHAIMGGSAWNKIPIVASDGVIEIGKYIDFHSINNDGLDYSTRLQAFGTSGNVLNLPTTSGTLAMLSDNVDSATNISNTGTVNLASATESNSITITAPSYTTDKPVKLLNFNWYSDAWSIGNIRSGYGASNGLGIYLNSVEKFRFSDGTFKVGNSVVWHAGNDGDGSGLDADFLRGVAPSNLAVLSATKLANTRTIWGQNFNGEGNVDGLLVINKSSADASEGQQSLVILSSPNDTKLQMGAIPSVGSYIQSMRHAYDWTSRPLLLQPNGGKVGIGTVNPQSQLSFGQTAFGRKFALFESEVDGLYFYGIGAHINGGGVAGLGLWGGTEDSLPTIIPNIFIKRNSQGGYVGIKTDNPLYDLDVNGTFRAAGAVTLGSTLNVAGNVFFGGTLGTTSTLSVKGTTDFDSRARLNITNGSTDYGRAQLRITGRLQNGNDGWSMNGRNNIIFAVNANESNVGIGDDGVDKMAIQYNMVTNQLGIVSESSPNSPIASISQNGAATFNGAVAGSRIFTGYDSWVPNSISCSNWFRSNGSSGWYNETYVAGINSDAANVVRTYSTNKFKVYNTEIDSILTLGGVTAANVVSSGAVVAGALNGTLPNDLPVATGSLYGVVKTGASINNNAGVVNLNGRHYTTTSDYTDAAVREITAELALGTGSMANGTLDQIQLAFAPLTTTRGLTANVIATNTGAGMGLKLSFRKDAGTSRWYIMIYNDSGAAVTRDGILLSIRGQQTI